MKKTLLTLVAALGFGLAASAAEVTFDFATNDYGLERKSGNASDGYLENGQTLTLEGVSVSFSGNGNAWRLWTDGLRAYKSTDATFSVSAEGFNVTSVTWTVASGATFALTTDSSNNITSWSGSAEAVEFVYTNTKSNLALKTLTITYGESDDNGDDNQGGNQGGEDNPGKDEPADGDVTFDFAAGNTYGMGPAYNSSSQPYVTSYEGSNGPVNIVLSGDNNSWRFWSDGLRAYNSKSPKFTISVTDGQVTGVTLTTTNSFYVDGYNENASTKTWTGTADEVTFICNSTNNNAISKIVVTYTLEAGAKAPAELAFNETSVSVTDLEATGFEPALTKKTTAVPTFTSSNTNVATVAQDGTVTLVAYGVTTITASTEENDEFSAGTASYTLNVLPANSPYTVAEALTLINNDFRSNAQVAGYVTSVAQYSETYKSLYYYIADEPNGTPTLYVYSGKGLDKADFTSIDDIAVGAKVVVEGTLTLYNGTPEFNQNNFLVSYEDANQVAAPEFSVKSGAVAAGTEVEITCATDGASIYYTTDETEPSAENGTLYTEPIVIEESTTLKAIAVAEGLTNSAVVTAVYTIFNPDATDATFDFTDTTWLEGEGITLPSEQSTGSDIAGNSYTVNAITINFPANAASNKARIWRKTDDSYQLRVFAGDDFTITAATDYEITGITFSIDSKYGNFSLANTENGELATSGTTMTFTPSEYLSSVGFSVASASRINKITVNYDGSASVAGIEADANAPVEFYNLQGVRVANPENGLYIRRQGNTATKVLVK